MILLLYFVEHWNTRDDMNDLIDDYVELKTRWYGLTYVNSAFYNDLRRSDACVGAIRQAAGTWGASRTANEGRTQMESRVED